ncbi:MAG: flagellar basal body rod protein FlgC [Salinibacter sp.]
MAPPRFLPSMQTSARGMAAQRRKLAAATENLANTNTSITEDGDPYALKRVVQAEGEGDYARLQRAQAGNDLDTEPRTTNRRHLDGPSLLTRAETESAGPTTEVKEVEKERLEYDPSHPNADEEGYVHYPDVNVAQEMARMTSANRVYEANLTAVNATKKMVRETFKI